MSVKLLILIFVATESSTCKEAFILNVNHTISSLFKQKSYPDDVNSWRYFGKGINELGHYQACIRNTDYAYFTLSLKYSGASLYTGMCLPKECNENDIKNALLSVGAGNNIEIK